MFDLQSPTNLSIYIEFQLKFRWSTYAYRAHRGKFEMHTVTTCARVHSWRRNVLCFSDCGLIVFAVLRQEGSICREASFTRSLIVMYFLDNRWRWAGWLVIDTICVTHKTVFVHLQVNPPKRKDWLQFDSPTRLPLEEASNVRLENLGWSNSKRNGKFWYFPRCNWTLSSANFAISIIF